MLYIADCELESAEDTVVVYFKVVRKSSRRAQKNCADGPVGDTCYLNETHHWQVGRLVRNGKCAVGTSNVYTPSTKHTDLPFS